MSFYLKKIFFYFFLLFFLVNLYAKPSCDNCLLMRQLQHFMQVHHIHGAALLITDHGITKTCLLGEADPEKHIPVTENTLFELGSITKTFTALLLADNVLSGKIRLDQSIAPDLDFPYSTAVAKMTYLSLATYTSGLPFNIENLAYNAPVSSKNRQKEKQYLKSSSFLFPVGTHLFYSNLGFGVLGQLLAKKEENSLSQLMQHQILLPLNMKTAGLDIARKNRGYLAQGFTSQGKRVTYRSAGLLSGTWAMRASISDMKNYLSAAIGEKNTPIKIRQSMRFTQQAYYTMPGEGTNVGLGWFITPLTHREAIQKLLHHPAHYSFEKYPVKKIQQPLFNPNVLIEKTGATDGFRAYIAVIPAKQIGIVIMINRFTPSSGALADFANKILLERSGLIPTLT